MGDLAQRFRPIHPSRRFIVTAGTLDGDDRLRGDLVSERNIVKREVIGERRTGDDEGTVPLVSIPQGQLEGRSRVVCTPVALRVVTSGAFIGNEEKLDITRLHSPAYGSGNRSENRRNPIAGAEGEQNLTQCGIVLP